MASKHIFIGLGGSGVNTVARTKYKIYERVAAASGRTKHEVMKDDYRFIFVDTDDRDIDNMNRNYKYLYENGNVDIISAREELVDLGDQNPHMIYQEAERATHLKENKRILEACSKEAAYKMENRSLRYGASAFRMKSRLSFARKQSDFIGKLISAINDLTNVERNGGVQSPIHYWIVSSCNGGTGSGVVNDVLYYVNMLHKTMVDVGHPKVSLILYMPKFYIDTNSENDKYPKNAYACLNEIETFQCLSRDAEKTMLYHRLAVRPDYVTFNDKHSYRPFEYCIPVDYQTDAGNVMGNIDNMYNNTAEMLFYVHNGAAARGFVSFLDNYQDGDLAMPAKCFNIPMGYVALRKPVKDFQDYLSIRYQFEMLKYGVIGNGIDGDEKVGKIMKDLFGTVIGRTLFERGVPGAYGSLLRSITAERIEDDMPENMIRDSKGEVVKTLPDSVSKTSAEAIVDEARTVIHSKAEEKKNAIDAIEKALWQWTEENATKYGLEYVNAVLKALDQHCVQLYTDYESESDSRLLSELKIVSSRKKLKDNLDETDKSLDELYQNAVKISVSERLTGSNRDDVNQYFATLKEWMAGTLEIEVLDELFSILKILSRGERGVIDIIRTHVQNLLTAAYSKLNDEKSGLTKAYSDLAQTFSDKSKDVTSVYLPDITSFVADGRWKEEGNKFSQWYAELVTPTVDYVSGQGMIPLRNDGQGSLEAHIKDMVRVCGTAMEKSYYIIGEETRIFTNNKLDEYTRMVEDILNFAYQTVSVKCRESNTLTDAWYNKPLASFYEDLDVDAKRRIRSRMTPSIFFAFNPSRHDNITIKRTFCVAPTKELAASVFGYQEGNPNSSFYEDNNSDVMYIMAGKIGVPFDYYMYYDSLKASYDATVSKELCHIHRALALAGGNPDAIRLPREISTEMKCFVKYLIIDRLTKVMQDYIYKPSEVFEQDKYHQTPLIIEENLAKAASYPALRIEDERIAFRDEEGGLRHFDVFSVNNPRTPLTDICEAFAGRYVNGLYGRLSTEVVKKLNWMDAEGLARNYPSVLDAMKQEYNAMWRNTESRKEKETISDILTILNDVYFNYNKFIAE